MKRKKSHVVGSLGFFLLLLLLEGDVSILKGFIPYCQAIWNKT